MIAFATPWLLVALVTLPVLWWLLRLLPPAPRRVRFPALRLLRGLREHQDSAARTPPWLLLLRLLILLLIIAAAAGPVLRPSPAAPTASPLLVVVDDGWAAARDWTPRRLALDEILGEAARQQRPVLLLGTAPPADGSPLSVQGPMTAAAARSLAQGLVPKPWASDQRAATTAVAALSHDTVTQAIWISDGIDSGHGPALAAALQGLGGGVTVLTGASGRLLRQGLGNDERPLLTVTRLPNSTQNERLVIRAVDGGGQVLGREEAVIAAGQDRVSLPLRLPTELRNRLARLDIEDEAGAGAVLLLDESWKRRVVGLVGDDNASAPLLSPFYYVERALAPHADLPRGDLPALLQRRPDALILADMPLPAAAAELTNWVEAGGVLIRFAGPLTARAISAGGVPDGLMPVRLRSGGRSLGGAMSWTNPQGLAPFPAHSPFSDLAADAEVKISAQVLAEPDADLSDRTWAHLADGTPLVTAAPRGQGWVVLIHTTANAAWSNLPLSGLFPGMLRRLTVLGRGAGTTSGALAASEVLDGFGHRQPASGLVEALPANAAKIIPGPRHPPGLYGPDGGRVAFNLSPHLDDPHPLRLPAGIELRRLSQRDAPLDLTGPLLASAALLLIVDMLIALRLRGLWRRTAPLVLLLVIALAPPARADDGFDFALRAGLATRLAFVHTGDGFVDGKTRAGLTALSRLVSERSTARLDSPMAVDLERDPVLFFPIVYWPLSAAQAPPSAAAIAKLNAYMRAGGMIVLDTGAEAAGAGNTAALRSLTEGLAIPALTTVTAEHVLTRSFYLLKELPGRWDGPVWVAEAGGDDHDGVSPVVVGGNDWAGAWAMDGQGRPSYPCVPGGERQRELAWRFGVNLVMYALTGNYKADQVHLPAILERLGQ
ncbi:DUF4159 domain-containing protein [Magnetospirillum sulfuroxidans]|uniref:DUF4159 domain-containing protein n=1 Tax=Magnetospirillum sulfuroxidans TaxID=611300 RepID=A0ABS5I9X7_9PROT|nr:DUF4159 domain-containing protein [Magnetospirillum sulfuroxidans]MBR9971237.1 DUF4159 domain-containing protein [Magnetospirillum sulfuroxidans]